MADNANHEDDYKRERSQSPRRSASPARRDDSYENRKEDEVMRDDRRDDRREERRDDRRGRDDDRRENPGTNLFVTGISTRVSEDELRELFGKHGTIVSCQIMLDPHTRESRGFGFVQFELTEEADAAREALTGENYAGRILSVERARRARPRTPTPGKYFGPAKREERGPRGPGGRGGGRYDDRRGPRRPDDRYDRYDDRRGGGYTDDRRRDDRYRDDDRYGRRGGDDRPSYRDDRPSYRDDRDDRGGRDGGRAAPRDDYYSSTSRTADASERR
ncbi:hypothetical protein PYCC9005_005251 [Savitreella phatthalungensis]